MPALKPSQLTAASVRVKLNYCGRLPTRWIVQYRHLFRAMFARQRDRRSNESRVAASRQSAAVFGNNQPAALFRDAATRRRFMGSLLSFFACIGTVNLRKTVGRGVLTAPRPGRLGTARPALRFMG